MRKVYGCTCISLQKHLALPGKNSLNFYDTSHHWYWNLSYIIIALSFFFIPAILNFDTSLISEEKLRQIYECVSIEWCCPMWDTAMLFEEELTLHLICQFSALSFQQQIKIWCPKKWTNGLQLSDWVKNIVGKGKIAHYEQFLLFPQCFQKLSIFDASKWVFME